MNDSFLNFSSSDYIEGACLTLENAKRHIHASDVLSKEQLWGIAISHLILGAEEYIKSFALLCMSGESDFLDEKEKRELFKNHKFKHDNILGFFDAISNTAVNNFDNDLFDILVLNKEPASKYSRSGYYINKVFGLLSLTDDQLITIKDWLKTANDQKNNGFYLGLNDYWESPERYKEEDYQKSCDVVQLLKKSIEPLFEYPLTDDDLIDFLNMG